MGATPPQLDFAAYPSQILWFFCAFFLLYVAVRGVVVPRVENAISSRYKLVNRDLEVALSLCAMINKEIEEQSAALHNAEIEAQRILKGAMDEITSCMASARDLLSIEVDNMLEVAQGHLNDLERDTKDELSAFSSELALLYFSKVSGDRTKEARLQELVAGLYKEKL